MKLSTEFFCIAEKYGDFEGARRLKQAGFDCLDYTFLRSARSLIGEVALQDDYVEYATKFRAYLDEIGMECNQAHAPNVKGDVWDESNPTYAKVVRAMHSASIMGAKYIIVHPQSLAPYDEKPVGIVNHNEKFYKTFEPYCKEFGIKIGMENVFFYDGARKITRSLLGTPQEINEMAKRMDQRYFGFCLDMGHTTFAGYYPHDFIAELDKGVIKCMHVHDNQLNADNHLLPHSGYFIWRKIIQELKKHGYAGDFTYEITNYFRRMPIELMPQAIDFSVLVARRLINKLES